MKIANGGTEGRGHRDAGALNPDEYLLRMSYSGPRQATLQTLQALHRAHLRAVPFENLDVHAGVPVVLEENALFDKIVQRRRGGFCYELNGLFAWLLEALGFAVCRLSARVVDADGRAGPPFDHLVLRVDLGGQGWLADVGFGSGCELPVALREGRPQIQSRAAYRLVRHADEWLLAERRGRCDWRPLYLVDERPRQLADFAAMCLHHQTAPASPFTRGRLCTRATPRGRLTLGGRRLIETTPGERREEELASETAVQQALRQHFGIAV
jgi:N-hydroxyarylamine O-acetyltransferase